MTARFCYVLCALLCGGGIACDEQGGAAEVQAPRSRVVTAKVKEQAPTDPKEEICDVAPSPGTKLVLPELAQGQAAPKASSERTWLNVWATWCKPCVEELPMLAQWKSKLAKEGISVSFQFLSADKDESAVVQFAKKTEGAPATLRIADPENLPEWLVSIGLDEGAPLPVHVLTNASGEVVCARAGAVAESDYAHVKEVLSF